MSSSAKYNQWQTVLTSLTLAMPISIETTGINKPHEELRKMPGNIFITWLLLDFIKVWLLDALLLNISLNIQHSHLLSFYDSFSVLAHCHVCYITSVLLAWNVKHNSECEFNLRHLNHHPVNCHIESDASQYRLHLNSSFRCVFLLNFSETMTIILPLGLG